LEQGAWGMGRFSQINFDFKDLKDFKVLKAGSVKGVIDHHGLTMET
jgi:hypothetical protein